MCWFLPTSLFSLPLSYLSRPDLINLPTVFHLYLIVSISSTDRSVRMFHNSLPLSFYWQQWGNTENLALFCWYTRKMQNYISDDILPWTKGYYTLLSALHWLCSTTLSHLHSYAHTARCPWPGYWIPHGSWCCVFIVLSWMQTLFSSPPNTEYRSHTK